MSNTYNVYDNILIKLENVYLQVEKEVDDEIASLRTQYSKLKQEQVELEGRVDVINSLMRDFALYEKKYDLDHLSRSLFEILCNKQIMLRMLQEKELLLNSYLVQPVGTLLPNIMQLNKEFKLRKRLQEIELLASFLLEDPRFEAYANELECTLEQFDLAIESGAADKIENVITLFECYYEKITNIYRLDPDFVRGFHDFKSQILRQANNVPSLSPDDALSLRDLQKAFDKVKEQKLNLELEVDKMLYQFLMLQCGQKIIAAEAKNASIELQSLVFKEHPLKQKIAELKQYKIDLNEQKSNFMKDPSVDGYTQAVQQLEAIENRFRRLMMHKNYEKNTLTSNFFNTAKIKTEPANRSEQKTAYNKLLFQVLHNSHVSSQDKAIILRLSKSSKMLTSDTGKYYFQRTSKRSMPKLASTFEKFQISEVH